MASRTVRAKPKFHCASNEVPVAALTFGPNTVPAILPHSHGDGLQAPNPSTVSVRLEVATTKSTTFLVAWFVFTHVPASALLGVGGTEVVGPAVAAVADGGAASSAAAVTAVELISAAVTARQVRLMCIAPVFGRNGQPFTAVAK